MPTTTARIETIRNVTYAALGVIFLGSGLWTLATRSIPPLPAWSYGAVGLSAAAILLAVAALSPRRAYMAVHDEGADAAWLRAQAFGYWAGIASFVVLGNAAALAALPAGPAFLGASTLTASAPFIHFLICEWRRGRG